MGSSNYPPGVSGNEPHITGEWPCVACGGYGYDEDEDGKHACPHCRGRGIEPEEFDVQYLQDLVDAGTTWHVVLESVIDSVCCSVFNREKPEDRRYLKLAATLRSRLR